MTDPWQSIEHETEFDPSHLVDPKNIRDRESLNKAEFRNVNVAFQKYLVRKPTKRSAPFDYNWILRLHEEMFSHVWTWAGSLRTRNLNMGVPYQSIMDRLTQLVGNLHSWNGYNVPLDEQAAMLHHTAVQIHPFFGGNGRWSRLLSNIWLRQNDAKVVLWPEGIIGTSSVIRTGYIEAIKAADLGDYKPLIAMQRKYTAVPDDHSS